MTTATTKLTDRQAYYFLHIARNEQTSQHGVANQLQKKGLVNVYHQFDRVEWNRVLATLTAVSLNDKGREFMAANLDALKAQSRAYSQKISPF